jgi:hypothetical protein
MYMVMVMSLNKPEFQAWNVSESQFPKDGTKTEQLKFLLNYAILAPSSHNTQPWLFKIIDDNIIELYAARSCGLSTFFICTCCGCGSCRLFSRCNCCSA